MCGRFSLAAPGQLWFEIFGLTDPPAWAPRYNIAPTQPVAAVLVPPDQRHRQFRMLQWGLIPSWAKAPGVGADMINARAETAATKPAFRAAFRQRRCLVLADGYYEWARQRGRKQPLYIRLRDGAPFAFAGMWEHWEEPGGEAIGPSPLSSSGQGLWSGGRLRGGEAPWPCRLARAPVKSHGTSREGSLQGGAECAHESVRLGPARPSHLRSGRICHGL